MAGHDIKYMRLCFQSLLVCSFVRAVTSEVIISEVSDKGTSGGCPDKQDWIELQNTGKSTVFLASFKLHDDNGPDHATAYVFPSDAKIESGAFLVLCTGVKGDDKAPQFKIGGEDTITLLDAAGLVVSTSGALQDQGEYDATWAFNAKTSAYEYTHTPTPGSENVFANNIDCAKCGTIAQSGQLSCCAQGGSWFKKCGNDKEKSEYTWFEGIEACKGKLARAIE